MAISAVFVDNLLSTNLVGHVPGDKFEGAVETTFGASDTYPSNGFTVAQILTGLNLKTVTHFMPECIGPSLDGTVNQFSYDKANGKVKLYNAATEVNNGTNVSAYKLYSWVRGLR